MRFFCIGSFDFSACKSALAAISFAGALVVLPQSGSAQATGPFAGYDGAWQGTGRVVGTNGNAERIKCRATYKVSPDGSGLAQTLTCASDSYRFDIRSDVISDGRSVHGSWQELTRNATGNLIGRINDGTVSSSVEAPGFTARLTVKMSGRKQIVTINPTGTDISRVDITLTH
jgi:hypothetical protein